MKKNILRKNAFVEITKSKSRFFSIFGIVAIGVSFFAGVKNAAPDMRLSADSYYKSENLAHYRIVSTLGFSESDISALEEIDGINVYPAYFVDALLLKESGEDAVRIMSLENNGENNDVNKLTLKEGRFPTAENECLIDAGSILVRANIGDVLKIVSGTDSDIEESLTCSEYTVVGIYNSPMYIDKSSRGNTSVGNGTLKSAIYINKANFKSEVFTEVYITSSELSSLNAYTSDYDEKCDEIRKTLEEKGESCKVERYDEFLKETEEKISDAKKELSVKEQQAKIELNAAKEALDDALLRINEGKEALREAKLQLAEAKQQLSDTRKELDSAYSELTNAEQIFYEKTSRAEVEITQKEQLLKSEMATYQKESSEYAVSYEEFLTKSEEFNTANAEYQTALRTYVLYTNYYGGSLGEKELVDELRKMQAERILKTLEDDETESPKTFEEILAALPAPTLLTKEEVAQLETQVEATGKIIAENEQIISDAKALLDAAKTKLDAAETKLNEGLSALEAAKKQQSDLKAATRNELDGKKNALDNGEAQYQTSVAAYKQSELDFAQASSDLEKSSDEYKKGLLEYESNKEEAQKKIVDAEREIRNAERQLDELSNPAWYIFDRSSNVGYTEYGNNADRINNIAGVFPVFFILVAALVCLTTMTRMVEEQRIQIGTLKALGYANGQIIFKYLLYALLATVFGAFIGMLIGQKLFPVSIISAYGMLYTIPNVLTPIDWSLGGATILISAAAVAITVYAACRSELGERPAQLMRPKSPRLGKRIFLEYLPIWKKVSFNGKVTSRNIFRYKRRMLMTVIGVAGCTALTLTGFGLRDSINSIVEKQYGELSVYDGMLKYDSEDESEIEDIRAVLNENGSSMQFFQKQMTVKQGSNSADASIFVPENSDRIGDFLLLRDRVSHEIYPLTDSGVIIDEKLSKMLHVKVGDKITVFRTETQSAEITVTAICENYPNHYVYMTENIYYELFGVLPDYNMFTFLQNSIKSDEAQDLLSQRLLSLSGVIGVSYTDEISNTFASMLKALDMIIWILLASAGALAFVVLYNLTNININERIREIATLKVLGYYDGEVDGYVFRENFILTLMGTAVGLFGGTFLAKFIIETAEIDLVMFGRDITVLSYVLSAVLTIAFSLLVSLYMHRYLKKVNMIEALKSVE